MIGGAYLSTAGLKMFLKFSQDDSTVIEEYTDSKPD